ncbi:hypothetical protein [Vibrio neonatus]|uniref:hypothetical protein n=1 Tax=Vibrio neonatus TaxID=278860 RepID=UPI0021C47272|nr:hypothetical protein [Vibrio neonatus]
MNKGILAVVIAGVVGSGTYVANKVMVDAAAEQLVNQVEDSVHNVNDNFLDIQIIKTEISGGDVEQEFAVYLTNGQERTPEPIYVTHNAKVAPFGLKVHGQLQLPKDKGLAAEFVKEVTSFNENIKYELSPTSQHFDLKSSLTLGVISDRHLSLKLGKLSLNVAGTVDDNAGQIIIDGAMFNENNNIFEIGKTTLDSVSSSTLHTADLTILNARVSDPSTQIAFNDVKLNTKATVGEKTDVYYDWVVGSLNVNTPQLSLPESTVGFKGKLGSFDTQKITAFNDAISNNQHTVAEDLLIRILGDGFTFSDVNMFVNDSNVKGQLTFNKANYGSLTGYQFESQVQNAISSEVDITLTPKLVTKLGIPQQMLNHFWTIDEANNYTTKVTLDNNKLMANGIPLQ